jgi:hypothetical protein
MKQPIEISTGCFYFKIDLKTYLKSYVLKAMLKPNRRGILL